jgi:hypothetical protein
VPGRAAAGAVPNRSPTREAAVLGLKMVPTAAPPSSGVNGR